MIKELFGARTGTRPVQRFLGVAIGALGLALTSCLCAVSLPARADIAPAAAPAPEKPGSVTHGHVFLHGPSGFVDVTGQIVAAGTQMYVSSGAYYQPININYYAGSVCDVYGTVIGYVDLG